MSRYYETLNVSPTAEEEVIRAAYKALMSKYHPDKFGGRCTEADRMAKSINEAYAVLSDPKKRSQYDAKERSKSSACSAEPGSTSREGSETNQPRPTQGSTSREGSETNQPRPAQERRQRSAEPSSTHYILQDEEFDLYHAIISLALWYGLTYLGYWAAKANFGPSAGQYGGALTFFALMAFVLWRPSQSSFKMMMLSGVYLVLGSVVLWNLGMLAYFVLSGGMKKAGLAGSWAAKSHTITILAVAITIAVFLGFVIGMTERSSSRSSGA